MKRIYFIRKLRRRTTILWYAITFAFDFKPTPFRKLHKFSTSTCPRKRIMRVWPNHISLFLGLCLLVYDLVKWWTISYFYYYYWYMSTLKTILGNIYFRDDFSHCLYNINMVPWPWVYLIVEPNISGEMINLSAIWYIPQNCTRHCIFVQSEGSCTLFY